MGEWLGKRIGGNKHFVVYMWNVRRVSLYLNRFFTSQIRTFSKSLKKKNGKSRPAFGEMSPVRFLFICL